MKNIFQSLSITALLSLFIPFISSCKDDDEAFNEWNATYVSLQRNDYLSGNVKTFNLTHDAQGINGDEIKIVFTAKTQEPTVEDVVVTLGVKTETEGLDISQISLSSSQVTLKKGQMISEEVTAMVDRTIFTDVMEKTSFPFSIFISSIATNDKNTVVSTNLNTLPIVINKTAYSNLINGTPAKSQLISDRSGWTIKVEEGVEGTGDKLIDGNTKSDIARDDKGFWFTVDFGEEKALTGMKTDHWGLEYAPEKVEILQSTNGTTWKSLSTLKTSGSTQNITFITPITTRYLKYQILSIATSGRTDITEFNVYESSNIDVYLEFTSVRTMEMDGSLILNLTDNIGNAAAILIKQQTALFPGEYSKAQIDEISYVDLKASNLGKNRNFDADNPGSFTVQYDEMTQIYTINGIFNLSAISPYPAIIMGFEYTGHIQ